MGAALAGMHLFNGEPRIVDGGADLMQGAYLGPEFTQADTEQRLNDVGAKFDVLPEEVLIDYTARALAEQKAVGWMQGRMEFGPRALGNRSILGDPRSATMQKTLNLKVRNIAKAFVLSHRVSCMRTSPSGSNSTPTVHTCCWSPGPRPASTTDEGAGTIALRHRQALTWLGSSIPAVTHIDYSARVQTVHANTNPRFHALVSRFKQLTNCGVLVNTSFNVRGEPIVCTPEDAFRCFMGTEIDVLVAGNCVLKKEEQDLALQRDYKSAFHPD